MQGVGEELDQRGSPTPKSVFVLGMLPSFDLVNLRLVGQGDVSAHAPVVKDVGIRAGLHVSEELEESDCAADANDLNALATAADKYKIKLPVKYAAVLGGYVLSDKNIFMDEAKIKVLAKKADVAKQKIKQYKNIYGNF